MGKLAGAVAVWQSGPFEGRAMPDLPSEGESRRTVHEELPKASVPSQDSHHRSTAQWQAAFRTCYCKCTDKMPVYCRASSALQQFMAGFCTAMQEHKSGSEAAH